MSIYRPFDRDRGSFIWCGIKEPVGAAPFSRNPHISPADRVGFDEPFLVNLDKDLEETTNVASDHPDVVRRLLMLAEQMRDDLGDYDRVGKNYAVL